MTFKIRVEATGLRRALAALSEQIADAVHRGIAVAVEEARERAFHSTAFHDRTGETRATIQSRVDPNPKRFRGAIFVLAKQGKFIENGTKPHTITARRKVLRFEVNGHTVFRRVVHHPGTKATHFMQNAMNAERDPARRHIDSEIGQAVAMFNR